jgi:GTP-binding protein
VLRANPEVTDLSAFVRQSRWNAPAGGNGAGGRKTGKRGANLMLDVPVGTLVVDEAGGAIVDLAEPGAKHEVARGGEGGRGNVHFKSSSRQAPDYAEPGVKGEEQTVVLDLKLIAEIGLVGPPNAGKSSLLSALTAAKPKVGAYPFTTLNPELGVMEVGERAIVIADIPGLVEGASRGAGLGLRFLRHVERTRVLLYVIDGAASDPWGDLAKVLAEVETFSPELAHRPYLIAVNKVDLEAARKLRARTRKAGVFFVSALAGDGLDRLREAMAHALARAPDIARPVRAAVVKLPEVSQALTVQRLPWGFAVRGDRVERLVERTNLDSDSALDRFQVELDRLGVGDALEKAGAQPGDTVRVGTAEFEYQP